MASASTTVGMEWPEEVANFAAEQGVDEALPKIMAMTRRTFPQAERVEVFLEDDWEIPDYRYVVVEVHIPNVEVAQVVASRQQWMEGLLECCPTPRKCSFVLGLEIGD